MIAQFRNPQLSVRAYIRCAWFSGQINAAFDPIDGICIDTVFIAQNSPHPDTRGLSVFLNTNALAFQILRALDPGLTVDEEIAMAENTGWKYRNGHKRKRIATRQRAGPLGHIERE
jgi:hypothetical protein